MAWVVDSVLVQDERVSERADLEQSLPVHGVARQPTDLKAEHDSDLVQANIGNQLLEASRSLAAPDWPRSLSTTTTRSSGQPRATARSRSAYWRLVLSVFSSTWRNVLWRTYR